MNEIDRVLPRPGVIKRTAKKVAKRIAEGLADGRQGSSDAMDGAAGRNYLMEAIAIASNGSRPFAHLPGGETVSYGDLDRRSAAMAAALVKLGVQPGDRVAAQIDKSLDALVLYLATVRAGGVFLPLNTAYTASELAYFLGDAEPRVFVTAPKNEATLDTLAGDAGARLVTLGVDGDGSLAEATEEELDAPGGYSDVPRGPDDLAAILYTSGTTGRSKGAMLSHDNLISNARALVDAWAFTSDDVLVHALPVFHTHGLFVATNVTLMAGATMHVVPKFDARQIIDLLPRSSVLMGVPTFYTRLLAEPDLAEAARGMRLFVSGSAPLLAETHTRFEAVTGHAILERYGMTETNMNVSNPYDGPRRAGTVGRPLPGVELRITDPDELADPRDLAQGEVGMIEVRGPNVFQGYWRMPDKTAEELRADGFFITGDLGLIDEQGYVQIVGRGKDLIISGGFNVYPKEVESVIDELEGVAESAVVGVTHPDFGEGVVAVVVPREDGSVTAEDVAEHLGDKLARYKQPKRIELIEALPRNTMGKVQKNVLRERYAHSFVQAKIS